MTKQRQFEVKITNQVLATFVVFLSLGLGYFLAKDQGWLKKTVIKIVTPQREYIQGEVELKPTYFSSTIQKTIQSRRTRRQLQTTPITIKDLSMLTWSLQGVTADWGGRVAPTIKSSYPLEVLVVVRSVEGVDQGVYHYVPKESQMRKTHSKIPEFLKVMGDKTPSLEDAPVILIISGNQEKTSAVLQGVDSLNLIYLEAGHAAQNLFLVAQSLDLGVNPISSFDSTIVSNGLGLTDKETPLYILPVGYPQEI